MLRTSKYLKYPMIKFLTVSFRQDQLLETFSRNQLVIYLMRKRGTSKKFIDGPQRSQRAHSIKIIKTDMIKLDGSHKGMKVLNVSKGNFFRPEIQDLFINSSKSGYVKIVGAKKLEDYIITIVQYGMILIDPITVRI